MVHSSNNPQIEKGSFFKSEIKSRKNSLLLRETENNLTDLVHFFSQRNLVINFIFYFTILNIKRKGK